jgi:hypothetical protein
MAVELSIVESVTELDTTVVEVILESASTPGPAGAGVATGGTTGQVLKKASATDFDTEWDDETGAGTNAPADATYLVGAAHGDLSAEIVVGATPGGELGGTWASPTVDATHSGSSHAAVQAAAEATAAAALSSHEGDTTSVHGIADTTALALTANHPSNATFNDHSARHEDGGADEISLTGLDGIPAALTTHEADTSNVHGITDTTVLATDAEVATAVSDHSADTTAVHGIADTSALALTSAHPTNATFNDHSARHENGGADEISLAGLSGTSEALQAHLDDAADAHDASAISIADAGGFYSATEVEAALQALGVLIDTEVAYVEFTATQTTVATTEGTAEQIVSLGSQTFDGTTVHEIEFYAPTWAVTVTTQDMFIILHDGSAAIGWIWVGRTPAANVAQGTVFAKRQFTPANGTRTYSIRHYMSGASTGSVFAGVGGAGAYMPGYVRLKKVY